MEQGHRDWKCPSCYRINMGYYDTCPSCSCFRSKAKKHVERIGDWTCPSCKSMVFASKPQCYKCGTLKIQPIARPGDWRCACLCNNFANRRECFKCGTPKPAESALVAQKECVVCMDRPPIMTIKLCGHLALCDACAFTLSECPICRQSYNPDLDLIKTFLV